MKRIYSLSRSIPGGHMVSQFRKKGEGKRKRSHHPSCNAASSSQ